MDALSLQVRLVATLVGGTVGITGAVLAICAAIGFSWSGSADLRIFYELSLVGVAGMVLGRAVFRVNALALSAGMIGIPDHTRHLRRGQGSVLLIFGVTAFVCALSFGMDVRAFVTSFGICAGVLVFTLFPGVGFFAFIAVLAADKVSADWAWLLAEPMVAVVALAAAAAMIFHWLRAPERVELLAQQSRPGLADARHEEAHAAEYLAAESQFAGYLGDVLAANARDPITPRRLWIGMGHDTASSSKARLWSLLVACLALASAHFALQARWDHALYFVASAILGFMLFSRFSVKGEAWLRTPEEQCLLKLSPALPVDGQLKLLVLRSLWPGIPADLGVWAPFSALALTAGWIGPLEAMIAGAGLLAVLLTCLGLMMSYLAHSRMRKRMWLPMFQLLCAAIGGAILIFACLQGHLPSALVGAFMLFGPFLLAAVAFALRPLQFPARPHVKG